jgi:TldD protein
VKISPVKKPQLSSNLILAAVLALAPFAAAPMVATAQTSSSLADAQKDPVFKAMLAELDRSKQQLQLQDFQKPFFIEYRIDDLADYEASATYGALTVQHQQRRRVARVTVRVGDYKMDSSNGRGDGSVQLATMEDDPLALRYALWAATDTAYKAALRDYTQKQAALKTVQTPPGAYDFSREKPVVLIEPMATLSLDGDAWAHRIVEATGLYRTEKDAHAFGQDVQYSNGRVNGRALNRYLVNTEGTVVRKGASQYSAVVDMGTQAADGMHVDRSYSSVGTTAAELDSAQKFHDGVMHILLALRDLRDAPVIGGEYHGPVLFSGDAAADTFAELFADPITAVRPETGTTARTRGPFQDSYQTRVLPDFLKVTDDPSLATFEGKGLLGSYRIDDQGVPAQLVPVVDQGKLVNYLIGREPVRDFPVSNGHGRASVAGAARPEIGVLHIEATKPSSMDELNQKLIAMGKDQGLEFVYFVQTFGPELTPRLLYRIHVVDGKRELVRGASLDDLDLRTLRSGIRAAGSEVHVDNIFADPSATVLAPPLLFDDITVKRAEQRNDKLPYYPPPD